MRQETRKEVVQKTEYVTKYIAFDGTEFLKEVECIAYEREKFAEMPRIKEIECEEAINHPPFDGGEYYESHEYRWFKPMSQEDIDLLLKAFPHSYGMEYGAVGEWVCIEDSGCDYYSSCLSDSIHYAQSLLGKFGFDMFIAKRPDEYNPQGETPMTYPEMDEKIVDILKLGDGASRYAAARILQLEKQEGEKIKAAIKDILKRIKLSFYYEFEEVIPSVMADKLDQIAREYGVTVEEDE